ncbi:MAG: aldehyde dehydrogenase family protein, partial [Thiogranum sp.]
MTFDIINPATGKKVNSFEEMPADTVREVLEKCASAQRAWAKTPFAERARLMQSVAGQLRANNEAYARVMVEEMGKIYSQGIAEVEKCAWACDYYAENAERFLASEDVATDAGHSFVSYKPLGVVLAVMPWNFPLWQVFRFAVPALMAGNGALLKHAPNVFGCSLLIEKIFLEAGFPENLFRSLLVDIPQTTAVIHNPLV